jgi:integrase
LSVYKPKKSPYWHYDFWLGGVRFSGSTGTASKPEARRLEDERKREARRDRELARSADATEIIRVFARFWEERGKHDRGAYTTLYRMDALRAGLTEILKARGKKAALGAIDEDVLAEYVARRRGEPIRRKRKDGTTASRARSTASVNRELQILRRILRRAAMVWKLGNVLPSWGGLLIAEADERVVTMGEEREAALLAAMREDYRPAARFLILSGLRRGNVFPLDPSAVDFEAGAITLRLKSRKPGGRLHVLPMTREMVVLIANEIGKHPDAVFTYRARSARGGRARGGRYPIDAGSFQKELKRAARSIGLPDLRVHDLRHVAGTRTLAATGNLRAAQAQLGHTRVSTTTKYAHILLEELRAAMQTAHAAPRKQSAN